MTPIVRTAATPRRRSAFFPWFLALLIVGGGLLGPRAIRMLSAHRVDPSLTATAALPSVDQMERHSIDIARYGAATVLLADGRTSALTIPRSQALTLVGWAADTSAHLPASEVDATVAGHTYRAAVGGERPDVANALGSATYVKTGFSLTLPGSTLPLGHTTLTFSAIDAHGTARYDLHRPLALTVTPK